MVGSLALVAYCIRCTFGTITEEVIRTAAGVACLIALTLQLRAENLRMTGFMTIEAVLFHSPPGSENNTVVGQGDLVRQRLELDAIVLSSVNKCIPFTEKQVGRRVKKESNMEDFTISS
ncbi:hypothetical protein G6F68_012364 [Rhizopus microsporus]|nr:hypothetical protein G6F68_012364 [Rhizopus microsporus]